MCEALRELMKEDLDAARAIGKGQVVGKRHYYFNNQMAIDYNENGTVAFIEFLGGIDGKIQPVIYGKCVFGTKADYWSTLGIGAEGYYSASLV